MDVVIYILTAIICYFISGMVHELGHIVVGLINGWKFLLLVIGPLGVKADQNGRIKFYLEKQITLWGGVGGTIPKSASEDNIKVWSKGLLGGPIASIVMGIIFLPIGIITKNMFFLLLGAMALGMGITCILPLPLKTGILYTDGGRWMRLHKGGQEADEEMALFKIVENEATSGDFSEIDLSYIEALTRSKDTGIKYYGYYYLYQYYKTLCNKEKMQSAIEKMEEIKTRVSPVIVKDCKID
jgi:hypothetical protein